MAEQCHMWTEGVRCNKQVTTEFYVKGKAANPKPWSVLVCNRHAKFYFRVNAYQVEYL